MPCYCRSIPKCARDIRKMERVLCCLEEVDQTSEREIKNSLSNLEMNHSLCITPDNISFLSEAILHSHDSILKKAGELSDQCQRELRSMEHVLSDMEESDDRYHDSDDD